MGIWKRASTLSSMLCIVTSMRVHVVKHDVDGIRCSHIPFIKLVGMSATLASVAFIFRCDNSDTLLTITSLFVINMMDESFISPAKRCMLAWLGDHMARVLCRPRGIIRVFVRPLQDPRTWSVRSLASGVKDLGMLSRPQLDPLSLPFNDSLRKHFTNL
jgi:hypothetical protein